MTTFLNFENYHVHQSRTPDTASYPWNLETFGRPCRVPAGGAEQEEWPERVCRSGETSRHPNLVGHGGLLESISAPRHSMS